MSRSVEYVLVVDVVLVDVLHLAIREYLHKF